jgi:predicted ATP-dependent protease
MNSQKSIARSVWLHSQNASELSHDSKAYHLDRSQVQLVIQRAARKADRNRTLHVNFLTSEPNARPVIPSGQ